MVSTARPNLPRELLDADAKYSEVLERHSFSSFLNPVNVQEARDAFDRGAEAPPFEYRPFEEADEALRVLDGLRRPIDHPLGSVVAAAAAETFVFVQALRDRTADAFHQLNKASGWYPTEAELGPAPTSEPGPSTPTETVPAEQLRLTLHLALRERCWPGWDVVMDPVMSARVLVDAPRRRVRVNPRARFRPKEVIALVAHEIDVHVRRAENGRAQPLQVFVTGLARSLATEEGLAIWAEDRVGTLTSAARQGQRLIATAIPIAAEESFRGLHRRLLRVAGPESAWTLALRLKRGLASPGTPGVYAKDSVYYVGYARLMAWLERGNDPRDLLTGKVGLEDPLAEWIAGGWLAPPLTLPDWMPRPPGEPVNPPG